MRAYTKGAKRRNRGGKRALFAQQQAKEDALVMTVEKDDPQKTVREARARQLGKPEKAVLLNMLCFDAGRAIDAGARDREEADVMWRVFSEFHQAHKNSVFHTTGKPMFPAVSKMEFLPERFEVRHDFAPVDLRTEEERHRDAMNVWSSWKHKLGFLTSRERYSIDCASRQMDTLYDGGITVHGQTFVAAMRTLCEVVDTETRRR